MMEDRRCVTCKWMFGRLSASENEYFYCGYPSVPRPYADQMLLLFTRNPQYDHLTVGDPQSDYGKDCPTWHPQDDLAAERAAAIKLYEKILSYSPDPEALNAGDDKDFEAIRRAIKTACREALQGQRELLQRIDAHLDTMMGDGSGLPFQTFLTQTALLRGQVKAVLARLANEGG